MAFKMRATNKSQGPQIANAKLFQKEYQAARTSGTLNLANRNIDSIPAVFLNNAENDTEQTFDSKDSLRWWESVEIRKVFLQCNNLTEISSEFLSKLVDSLILLDAHDNKLASLGIMFGDLKMLQVLNICHNKLTTLPDTFVSLESLVDLNVSHNNLTALPLKWSCLTALSSLNLSHNKLTSLPESFSECTSLTVLDLSNNMISKMPKEFSRLTKLQSLDLSFNKIAHHEFSSLNELQLLKLDRNCLTSYPDVSNCTKLKELSVCDNQITNMTVRDLKSLNSITILNIRGNKLSNIPDEVAFNLENIERIDLANNDLSMVPPYFGKIESLKSLCLDGNPLRTLRRDVVSRGTVYIKQWLVSRLPESNDAEANQSGGQTYRVPSGGSTRTGAKINLSNIGAENVVSSLNSLEKTVKDLTLSKNRLSTLDLIIGSFENIIFLDLSSNLLARLPVELGNLKGLRQLNISTNKFSGSLPSIVYTFKSLEVLIASDNALEEFDVEALICLDQLSTLDISNNNISKLPVTLSHCPSLKHLEVAGNPFRMPRPEIVRKGSHAILEYLRAKAA